MDINKGLMFVDGLAISATAKVLDLGFNGDFDYKNTAWNRLFVSFAAKSTGTDLTLKVYSKQAGLPSVSGTDDLIATLVIPQDKVRVGGAFAFPMPTGLKRYTTVAFSVTASTGVAPDAVYCGITNDVDTDAIALGGGIDWTNYEASTLGTAVNPTPMKNVAGLVSGESIAAASEVATDYINEGETLPSTASSIGELFRKTGSTNPGLYVSTGTTTPGWKTVTHAT